MHTFGFYVSIPVIGFQVIIDKISGSHKLNLLSYDIRETWNEISNSNIEFTGVYLSKRKLWPFLALTKSHDSICPFLQFLRSWMLRCIS